MSVVDLFSKRQRRLRGEMPDVYQYDEIPEPLRVQVIHIWDEVLGNERDYHDHYSPDGPRQAYAIIVETLRREYGVFRLPGSSRDDDHRSELCAYLLKQTDVERVIDAIELSFRLVNNATRNFGYLHRDGADAQATAAIAELNARLREHGVGYAFESGEIIRVDSQLVHSEVVRPALHLLSGKRFRGAQDEFMAAHDHYRKGDHKDALAAALKSLESTMKSICDIKGWTYDGEKATAKTLLDLCFRNGLIPEFWQNTMGGLRSLLEGGVPTARNRLGGHGQGAGRVEVPAHIVAFVLHMTASAIVFLVQACDE